MKFWIATKQTAYSQRLVLMELPAKLDLILQIRKIRKFRLPNVEKLLGNLALLPI
jgi:hypothetical protein